MICIVSKATKISTQRLIFSAQCRPNSGIVRAEQTMALGIRYHFQSARSTSSNVIIAKLGELFFVNPIKGAELQILCPCAASAVDSKTNPTILACSSSIKDPGFFERLKAHQRKLLQAIWRRVKKQCLWIYEALIISTRTLEVAVRLTPLITVLTPAAIVSTQLLGTKGLSDVAWWYALKTLQALGPAWQKLGQWAATRPDLFPAHICDRLSTLHDRGFSHPWKYTHAILCESFGSNYAEKGLTVQEMIGCGSAAQVYRGTLQENPEAPPHTVAVKILHPRFATLVERDLVLMQSVANMLHSIPFWETIHVLNLPRVSQNFAEILRNQADLRIEARNLTLFRKNFYGNNHANNVGMESKSQVIFPKPIEDWCARDVLVEDLVEDARPIAEFIKDSSEEGWIIRKQLAKPLLRSFLKMVFVDSWVHCDLHPGNVMVQTTDLGGGKMKRSIVFLDAGIACHLSPNDQKNLIDLFRAVLTDNGYEAGKLMVLRAKHERCSQVEGGIDAFANGVAVLVSEFHDRRKSGLTLGAVHIGSLLHRVLELCRDHGVEIDPSMASIVLSTLVLEGLGRSLHPDLNLIDFAIPFVMGGRRV